MARGSANNPGKSTVKAPTPKTKATLDGLNKASSGKPDPKLVKLTRAERANTRADAAAKEAATDKATTTDEEVAVEKNWDAASTEDTAPKNTNEHIANMNNVSFEEESPAKKDTEMEEEAEEQDKQVIDGEKEDVEMETPNSPIKSPVKKKSKRASLNSLVTPKAKPSEESSKQPTKSNQSSKRKADAPTDPKEVTPAPAEKSAPKATVDPPSESHAEKQAPNLHQYSSPASTPPPLLRPARTSLQISQLPSYTCTSSNESLLTERWTLAKQL